MAKAAKKNTMSGAKASLVIVDDVEVTPNCGNCRFTELTGLHLVCSIRLPAFIAQVNDPRRRIVSAKNVCAFHQEKD